MFVAGKGDLIVGSRRVDEHVEKENHGGAAEWMRAAKFRVMLRQQQLVGGGGCLHSGTRDDLRERARMAFPGEWARPSGAREYNRTADSSKRRVLKV